MPLFSPVPTYHGRQASLSTGDFQCVVYDFSQICRGKLAAESLNKYLAT